jgi:endonuclease YncB( thermonuclease family)
VFLKFDKPQKIDNGIAYAYVYLRNKIFVNKTMLKLGYARPASYQFSLKKKFEEIEGLVTV